MSKTPATDWYQDDDADDECMVCGGETYVHECFDGFCEGMAAELRQVLADALAGADDKATDDGQRFSETERDTEKENKNG